MHCCHKVILALEIQVIYCFIYNFIQGAIFFIFNELFTIGKVFVFLVFHEFVYVINLVYWIQLVDQQVLRCNWLNGAI
jgi:hypothetical protein